MFKLSAQISSLVQQSYMAAFALHFTSPLKGLNLPTKMHQKISKQIFFYPCWQNQHTHRPTFLQLETVTSIFIICQRVTFHIAAILFSFTLLTYTTVV